MQYPSFHMHATKNHTCTCFCFSLPTQPLSIWWVHSFSVFLVLVLVFVFRFLDQYISIKILRDTTLKLNTTWRKMALTNVYSNVVVAAEFLYHHQIEMRACMRVRVRVCKHTCIANPRKMCQERNTIRSIHPYKLYRVL